jgi:hypothetical protein
MILMKNELGAYAGYMPDDLERKKHLEKCGYSRELYLKGEEE